jgi:hypothetical protein
MLKMHASTSASIPEKSTLRLAASVLGELT